MADKRELILARLLEVAQGSEGIAHAYRNKDEISDSERPAVIILDADEQASEDDPKSRPANAPRRVTMTPEIYILQSSTAESLGTLINALRAKLVKAILTDETLLSYTHDARGIRYDGCGTDLARGRQMEGSMGVSMSFTYILNPADL